MLKRYIYGLCMVFVLTPLFTYAKGDNKAFVEKLNQQIEELASASSLRVAYRDAEQINNPVHGSYLSFKDVMVTFVADRIRYQLAMRNIGLRDEGKGVHKVMFPVTVTMIVTDAAESASSPTREYYRIRLSGMPNVHLQSLYGDTLERIRIEQEEGLEAFFFATDDSVTVEVARDVMENGRKKEVAKGQASFERESVETDGWISIKAPSPADIAPLLKTLRFTPDN